MLADASLPSNASVAISNRQTVNDWSSAAGLGILVNSRRHEIRVYFHAGLTILRLSSFLALSCTLRFLAPLFVIRLIVRFHFLVTGSFSYLVFINYAVTFV